MDEDNPLYAEIQAEKASSYFACVRKMQSALAALAEFDRSSPPEPTTLPEKKNVRAELLAECAERVWFFVIQREAMKLPHYDELFADYDIPDEVRRSMGPRMDRRK